MDQLFKKYLFKKILISKNNRLKILQKIYFSLKQTSIRVRKLCFLRTSKK